MTPGGHSPAHSRGPGKVLPVLSPAGAWQAWPGGAGPQGRAERKVQKPLGPLTRVLSWFRGFSVASAPF